MDGYLRQWRKCNAEVQALVQSSSSDDATGQEIVASADQVTTDSENATSCDASERSDYSSDFGLSDGVIVSSESNADDSDGTNGDKTNVVPDLTEELVSWSTTHGCTRAALNDMLDIWRRHGHRVPKDARTLLQTPRSVASLPICGGQYIYFGLASGILKNLAHILSTENNDTLELSINIDGVPLFKSRNIQFWPILCSLYALDPFIVALFCGTSKPNPVDEYLADFILEMQDLVDNGLTVGEIAHRVVIKSFICDAPARAFLKCIKGHNAYYGCERCTERGSWQGRVVFNSEEASPSRNGDDFNNILYEVHQVGRSPLIALNMNCIQQFSLDYMHLVCLGVVRRMLSFLTKGPNDCRLSVRQKAEISDNLLALRGLMPSEFARQPRGFPLGIG